MPYVAARTCRLCRVCSEARQQCDVKRSAVGRAATPYCGPINLKGRPCWEQLRAGQAMWLLQLQALVLVWYAMHRCVTAYLTVFSSVYTTTCAADDSQLSVHLVLVAELSSIWSQLCVILQQQRNKRFL